MMTFSGFPFSREVGFSVLVLAATSLLYSICKAFQSLWLQPRRIRKALEAQGFTCLRGSLLTGNMAEFVALTSAARSAPMPGVSHDIVPRILPHLVHWSKNYGDLFVFWFGSQARIYLTEPEQAKEVLNNKFGHYRKVTARPDTRDLVGSGLVTAEGETWAQHRRILNPAFFLDKLKAMIPTMAACTAAMMERWEGQVGIGEVIDVHDSFRTLTADIIAHTAFGSSYAEGKQVFEMQYEQQLLVYKLVRSFYIPGSRFIPTATNLYRWKLNNTIVRILTQMIEKRMEAEKVGDKNGYGHDLLGLMMSANKGQLQGNQKNLRMGIDEMIDECKTFYFAGHETTSSQLMWTCLLLASSPDWQERAREEVHAVCGTTELPTAESVNQLKLVGMVLNEGLRLYPPATEFARRAGADMRLGKLFIPAGTVVMMPVIAWHHDSRFWGPDVNEFRPDRFDGGSGNSTAAFMPFSMGPRNCIGQIFATLEAKVVLSSILQRYRFRLSPSYQHAPSTIFAMQPQFGMPMLFEKLL